MAKSMEYEVSGSNGCKIRITFSFDQDAVRNVTKVSVTKLEVKGSTSRQLYFYGTISVNNVPVVDFTTNYATSKFGGSISSDYTAIADSTIWRKSPAEVQHSDSGISPFTQFSIDLQLIQEGKTSPYTRFIKSESFGFDSITRVSGITANPVALGSQMTISVNRVFTNWTNTIEYRCGLESGTIETKTSKETIQWTPPLNLAIQSPDSTTVSITLTVRTFSDNTENGSSSIEIECPIPTYVAPTVSSVTLIDSDKHLDKYGKYIQGQSSIVVRISFASSYGSPVKTAEVSCGQDVYTKPIQSSTSSVDVEITPSMYGAGVAVTAKVIDARGRIGSKGTSINVAEYSRPSVTINSAYRCAADGTKEAYGKYAIVSFTGKIYSLQPASGKLDNTPVFRVKSRSRDTGGGWLYTTVTLNSNKFEPTNVTCIISLDEKSSHDIAVEAEDDFYNGSLGMGRPAESLYITVGVAFSLMDYDRYNKAIGFGQIATKPNAISFGLDADMNSHRIVNIAAPREWNDAVIKGYVDERIKAVLDIVYSSIYAAPTIIAQPSDCYVGEDGYASFSVMAAGQDLSYRWEYSDNGSEWKYNSDGGMYVFLTDASGYNNRMYRCIITDKNGASVTSNTAKIITVLIITSQPTSVSVASGGSATFTVSVAGFGSFTYRWQCKKNSNEPWIDATGTYGNTLQRLIVPASYDNNGYQYRCIITDSNNSEITSNVATLIVT